MKSSLRCLSFASICALFVVAVCPCGAWGKTLRIVSYNIDCADQGSDNNITGATHSLPIVIQAIGLHHLGTNAQPVDVLGLEELQDTTLSNFVAQLNIIYGAGSYVFDPASDPNTGGGPDGLIYNSQTIQVMSARALPAGQTVLLQSNGAYTAAYSPGGGVNGVVRAPMVYQLRPVGSGSNADFYMYVSHARSTSDDSVGDARYAEAQEVRSDAKYNLPAGAHVIYSGDWNLFNGSGENAYKCLTGQTTSDGINWADSSAIWGNTNQTQAYDPTSKTTPATTTTWGNVSGDNASYLYGDATDSLASRIDIQLMNGPMLGVYNTQAGVQLAPDTSDPFDSSNFPSAQYPYAFEVFGNNGTTARGSSVTSSANHSLDDLTNTVPSAPTVYADLLLTGSGSNFTGSDHYPVVADYNVVSAAPAALSLTNIQTVFIILMENHNWSSILGSASAPYINNTVLPMASHAEQFYNPPGLHPSLPNYLWLEAGTNFGITSDLTPSTAHQNTTNHLVTLLKNAEISWRAYQEDICGCYCPLVDTNLYAVRHEPMAYFDDVSNTNNFGSAYCVANIRPYTQLAGDLQSNTVARYNFLTPNLCDDMHNSSGCATSDSVKNGDTWLANNLPAILISQAYSNNGAIFITWDEAGSGDGPIGMIVLSPLARGGGYSNSVHYTHSSTLRTFEEIFNVGPMLGDAANATDLSDLFIFGAAQLSVSPAPGLTASGPVGGPFSPSSQIYTLSNSGSATLSWTVTNSSNWLSLSATSGTLAPRSNATVTVSPNANANSLGVGGYSDTVAFTNTSNGAGNTSRAVSLTVNSTTAQLSVTPAAGFSASGPPGGTFNPGSQAYTLSNTGGAALGWTASNTANWLTLSAASGTLAPGSSTNVIASINANANSLSAGSYSDTVSFANTTNGAGNTTRSVNLSVSVSTFGFYDDFSTFAAGNLVGQQNWLQESNPSTLPLQVSGGQVVIPAGQTVDNQDATKNFTLTNSTVFYGMTLTVSNAVTSSSPSYFNALWTSNNGAGFANYRLSAKAATTSSTSSYALAARVTGQSGDPYTFGATNLAYGTRYVVIVQATAGGNNMLVYLNPTNGNQAAQAYYVSNFIGTGTAPLSVGSFVISQFGSGTLSSDGVAIGKAAVSDNFTSIYNFLNNIVVLTPFQSWQVFYFGSTNSPSADPNADPDSDGMSNYLEFLAGTNPTNSASVFRITTIAQEGSGFRITWMTGVGKTNALQLAPGTAGGGLSNNFSDLFFVTNTTGSATNYLDAAATTNSTARYYRVRLVQ
jgi:hypothetical protein